jgi:Leucine-rich repeat (LRR) protein
MLSVQEYIKKNFSKFRKSTTEVMDISNKNLEGELNLEGFNKLKVLNCSANSLTKLNVSDCPRLTKIFCSNNQLTSVDFLKQLKHPERLVSLDIGDNDFLSLEDDLSFFDPFVNLKKFYLNNDAAD